MNQHPELPALRISPSEQNPTVSHPNGEIPENVPSENIGCPCGAALQTREHVLKPCRLYYRHRQILGHGRHARTGRLLGTVKGTRKSITFMRRLGAFDKKTPTKTSTQEETERARRDEEEWELLTERDNETRACYRCVVRGQLRLRHRNATVT